MGKEQFRTSADQDHFGEDDAVIPKGEFSSGSVADTYERQPVTLSSIELGIQRRYQEGEISLEQAEQELAELAAQRDL